jgi:hypothetical protein
MKAALAGERGGSTEFANRHRVSPSPVMLGQLLHRKRMPAFYASVNLTQDFLLDFIWEMKGFFAVRAGFRPVYSPICSKVP